MIIAYEGHRPQVAKGAFVAPTAVLIGRVTVGHGATPEAPEGCRVDRGAVVGIRATVLPGAIIGERAMVAAGSVVPEKMLVPARHFVAGVPAHVKKPLSNSALHWVEIAAPAYKGLAASYLRQGLGVRPAPRLSPPRRRTATRRKGSS